MSPWTKRQRELKAQLAAAEKTPGVRPGAREITDSGEAYIILEYSKDTRTLTPKEIAKNLDYQEKRLRKELQAKGYIVYKTYSLVHGQDGDMKVCAKWYTLGPKQTKGFRRAQTV